MLATILSAFQVPDIRRKIGFTAAMLLIYRLGSHIPVPGVNLNAVNSLQKQLGGSNILGLLNLFSGGSLSRIRSRAADGTAKTSRRAGRGAGVGATA